MGSVKIKWMFSNPIPFRRAQPQNLDQSLMNAVPTVVQYWCLIFPFLARFRKDFHREAPYSKK